MSRIECKTCDESGAIRDMDGELIDCPECNDLGWVDADVTEPQLNDIKTMQKQDDLLDKTSCQDCKFCVLIGIQDVDGNEIGECWRYPPVPLDKYSPDGYPQHIRPTLYPNSCWCGEFVAA